MNVEYSRLYRVPQGYVRKYTLKNILHFLKIAYRFIMKFYWSIKAS